MLIELVIRPGIHSSAHSNFPKLVFRIEIKQWPTFEISELGLGYMFSSYTTNSLLITMVIVFVSLFCFFILYFEHFSFIFCINIFKIEVVVSSL